MINVANYKTKQLKQNALQFSKDFQNLLQICVDNYFADKPLFNKSNISIYPFDEYTFKTNVLKNHVTTYYIEINQPDNYRTQASTGLKFPIRRLFKDNKIPDLFLTLKEIKQGIVSQLATDLNEDFVFYTKKLSILVEYTGIINENQTEQYYFEIIPCLTYINENSKQGVIYFTDNEKEVNIDYPQLAFHNYQAKNTATNGAFANTVLILKNILVKECNYTDLPFGFIETLLYNVPDSFFGNFNQTILPILNYLRNENLLKVKTIDQQDFIFTSKYKTFSLLYAKKLLSDISSFVRKNI